MKRIILATSVVLSCFIGTAAAETTSVSAVTTTSSDGDCAKARTAGRVCSLVFDGDTVDGTRVGGDGDNITVASNVDFGNLIRLRTSFRDMIVHAAEDL